MSDQEREQPVEPGQVWRSKLDLMPVIVEYARMPYARLRLLQTGARFRILIATLRKRYRLEPRP